jgi:hypothetical protein
MKEVPVPVLYCMTRMVLWREADAAADAEGADGDGDGGDGDGYMAEVAPGATGQRDRYTVLALSMRDHMHIMSC